MKITNDTVVTVQYMIRVKDGQTPPDLARVFKTEFLYGRDPVIPAMEKALLNREEGEQFQIEIPPEQAFGPYDEKLVNEIPLSQIRYPDRLKKGELYEEVASTGQVVRFVVKDIGEDYVVVDFNHPAAGKSLLLDVEVLGVRAASAMDILRSISCSSGGG
jgi:FKBP-type peptidyl-prolyl cis-trans isomerase SlyD